MQKIVKYRNFLRVLGLSSFMVVALSFGAGMAKADVSISGGNNTTGSGSLNQNNWSIDHTVSVDINNESTSANDQTFSVDTGSNTVDQNTKVGDLMTGNFIGNIHVDNSLNTGNIHLMNADPGNIAFVLGNGTTGFQSDNENNVAIDVTHNIDINNTSSIENGLNLSANTGDNSVTDNTVAGNFHTGNISMGALLQNQANGSMGNVDLGGMGGVSVTGHLLNTITGANSTNTNNVSVDANTNVDVNNTASINNDTNVSANTGGNTASNNTVLGNVSTGGVSLNVTTTNSAN